MVNKKSNILTISYYIDIDLDLDMDIIIIYIYIDKSIHSLVFGTFATPNTKNAPLLDVLNVLNFYNMLQYHHNFGTVWTDVA